MKIVSRWQARSTFNSRSPFCNMVLASILSFASSALGGCGGAEGVDGSVANQISKKDQRSATLSWNLPKQRVDGSGLELYEISIFKIYHTTDDGAVEEILEVSGDETDLDLSELKAGTHFFTITVVDSDGSESDFSNIVTKTIL